jgi:rhodanese-related sulfurtransferase
MDGSIKEISPVEAWEMLGSEKDSILVDVRTLDEIKTLGSADITSFNKNVVFIPWINDLTSRDVNENFLTDLKMLAPNKDAKIVFMCKAGRRSFDAAMVAVKEGYASCFNVTTGFGQGAGDSGWKSMKLACKKYV